MTKKAKTSDRFNYAKQGAQETQQPSNTPVPAAVTAPTTAAAPTLTTVPKRTGRMTQEREQLNVRLPTQLKRRALAAAAMDGLTVGELIERLLLEHLGEA